MRAKAASPLQRWQQEPLRGKPKREFLVQEHRKEFDDYMLQQVKKNKKSVKQIKKTINILKEQMDHLTQQNKKQRFDYERLSQQIKSISRQASEPRINFTARRSPHPLPPSSSLHKTRKKFVVSKESSFSGRSSQVQAPRSKAIKQRKKGQASSKSILKRKIEDLKEKAHIIKQNAQEIQQEIHKKIEQKLVQQSSKHLPAPHPPEEHHKNDQGYQQLMELLKTNKRIQEPSPQKPNQSKQEPSLNMDEAPQPTFSDKSMMSTNRDPTPLKNSIAVSYYERPPAYSPIGSQTNLLDSEKHLLPSQKQILPKSPKQFKMSRCVEVQVVGQQPQSESECPFKECRGSGSELSFEGLNSQQQLKQLEFEFDHLVRQQLLSNDPKQKEALGKSIRTLLERISVIRQHSH